MLIASEVIFMKIDWKRKLTSRKFWAAVCGFVSMWIMALWKDASIAQTVTGMIMAAGSLIAYIIGEGLADSKPDETPTEFAVLKAGTGEMIADITKNDAICKNGYKVVVAGEDTADADEACEECMIHYDDDNEWKE